MLVNSKFYMNVECKYFSKEQKIHFICGTKSKWKVDNYDSMFNYTDESYE